MIVLDTTILVYAVGDAHRYAEPCQRILAAASRGRIRVTTTAEAVQEFVHVRARRRTRKDAVAFGSAYVELFAPLLPIQDESVLAGLRLFERTDRLGSFDAVLAATAINAGATALVSADQAFGKIPGLRWIDPSSSALADLLDFP